MGKENRQRLAAPYIAGMSSNLVFPPPSTPKGCERGDINVGKVLSHDTYALCGDLTKYEHPKCEDIPPGQWWVSEKAIVYGAMLITYCSNGGFVREYYDKDGCLSSQVLMDEEGNQVRSTKDWTGKYWSENGDLIALDRGFSNGDLTSEDKQMISQAIKEDKRGFILGESFYPSGARFRIEYCCVREGKIYRLLESWSEERRMEGYLFRDLEGRYCSPENTPTICRCFEGGIVEADYGVVRSGKTVLHRTDGPALSRQDAWGEEHGRYFLEGVEYTKAEWEEKVGRA